MGAFKNLLIVGNTGTYGAVTGMKDMVSWSAIVNPQDNKQFLLVVEQSQAWLKVHRVLVEDHRELFVKTE